MVINFLQAAELGSCKGVAFGGYAHRGSPREPHDTLSLWSPPSQPPRVRGVVGKPHGGLENPHQNHRIFWGIALPPVHNPAFLLCVLPLPRGGPVTWRRSQGKSIATTPEAVLKECRAYNGRDIEGVKLFDPVAREPTNRPASATLERVGGLSGWI